MRRILTSEVDVLADQIIATGYALNAVEGMAAGLPVLANLEDDALTAVLRRYSYLDECPILSATPETIADRMRALVVDPDLRERLGRAGAAYAAKYHSDETAQYLYGSIYRRIWNGEDVALLDLFHPLKSDYNRCCRGSSTGWCATACRTTRSSARANTGPSCAASRSRCTTGT